MLEERIPRRGSPRSTWKQSPGDCFIPLDQAILPKESRIKNEDSIGDNSINFFLRSLLKKNQEIHRNFTLVHFLKNFVNKI